MVYDALLVIGVLMVATVPFLPFLNGRVLVPREVGALSYGYWLWEIVVVVLFFGYFWTRRGQTIGMLAWRLRIERNDGALLNWRDAVARLAMLFALSLPVLVGYWWLWRHWPANAKTIANYVALLPLAITYVWICIDRDKAALHDRWTHTRVIVLPKRSK
jgi:uncharacterized RDD family membrane protein YckC